MPTLSGMQLPQPKSWEEFHNITLSCLKIKWGNPNLTLNGRTGQAQDGVDIWGNDNKGRLAGIQSKISLNSINIVKKEILKTENFKPALGSFYMATASPSDSRLQEEVRVLSQERVSERKFPVAVLFWEDLIQESVKNRDVFKIHYPQINLDQILSQPYILEITGTLAGCNHDW